MVASTAETHPGLRVGAIISDFGGVLTSPLQSSFQAFQDTSGVPLAELGKAMAAIGARLGVNPLDLLATSRYSDSAGSIVVGRDDRTYRPQQQHVFAACRAAGMDVSWLELPGGHTWQVWAPGLERSLPWLGVRLGLTAP